MVPARRRFWKRVLLAGWCLLIGLFFYAVHHAHIPFKELPDFLRGWIERHGNLGPLLYILAYTLRPLTLFPPFIFNAAAGLLWGPFYGILYTLIGENLSASFAFWLARSFGQDWFSWAESHLWQRLEHHLERHGFITVLVLRLMYMPFDAVNFGCGLTRVRYKDYLYASALGTIPSVITFVYFGDGWFHPRNLLISAGIFAASLGLARIIKTSRTAQDIFTDVGKV
jgi:uncharacterized membrane protein YdjX (TVP38/TMEM64 family)